MHSKFMKEIKYELIGFMGRKMLNRKPKIKRLDKIYLNIGCGNNYVEGYINADYYDMKKFFKKKKRVDWELDIRYPLNCDSNYFDGVFCEHVLEHLTYKDALKYISEIYRVLKKGCVFRVTVPDIEKFVKFYIGDSIDYELEFKNRYKSGCKAISDLAQNYGHISLWDYEELSESMKSIGFMDVKKYKFMQGLDDALLLDKKDRVWSTLYVEGVKA